MSSPTDAESVVALLRERSATVAAAESLTGGLVASAIVAVPGASAVMLGGVVAYATHLKTLLLGVPDGLVAAHGVVSAECALAMAEGVRSATGSVWGMAITGVAGPEGQEGMPVGTVFVAVSGPGVATFRSLRLSGDRSAVREGAVWEVISLLADILRREEPGLG